MSAQNPKNSDAADEVLRASELRYRRLFESAKDGILILDAETGMVVDVNPFLIELLGISREAFLDKKVWELGFLKDIAANENKFAELRAQEHIRYEDLPLETAAGLPIAVEFVSNVYLVNGHRVIQCNIRDITERKRSEERTQLLLTATFEGIAFSEGGRLVDVNDQCARMFGYERSELIGMEIAALIPPQERERVQCNIIRGIESFIEHQMIRKDGSVFTVEAHGKDMLYQGRKMRVTAVRDITERKRAEEAQRSSQQILERIINAIPVRVFWKDKNLIYLGCNVVFAHDAGFADPKGLIGKDDYQMAWRDQAELYRSNDRHVVASGCSKYLIEEPQTTPEGNTITLLTTKIPLRSSDGEVCGVIGTYMDITELKRVESDSRESNEKLALALRSSGMGIWQLDLLEQKRYFDDQVCHCLGIEPARFDGTPEEFYAAVHPADREGLKTALNQTITTGASYETEYRSVWPDGSLHFISARGQLVRNAAGKPKQINGLVWDITAQKKAVQLLERSQRNLAEAQRQTHIGSFEVDYQAGSLEWSEEMFRICGVNHEDFQGKEQDFLSRIHPEDFEKVMKCRKEGLEVPGPHNLDFRIVRPNGETRFIRMAFETTFDADGTPLRRMGTFQDISEMKQAETEKAKLEVQLRQAQKMEAVGRLAGGVAHDFNNMLAVIIGRSEMALEQLDPTQPQYDNFTEIRKAAERSADLTRQLLAFARQQTIAPRILDLNETVAGMLIMLRRLIGEDIGLNWRPSENLWPVSLDPSQIDQILANLCVNARDAIAGVGEVNIETQNSILDETYCTAHTGSVPGEYVQLAVSDDGCGMDKETLAQIFEPFFTTKGVGEGTGLGLATVYGIVKQNNGYINVYSEPGQGTTITIYLPRHVGKAGEARTGGYAEALTRGHETILLVEDEPAILKLAKMMLEKQGYIVLAASLPGEAIRLAKEHIGEIHLLMTDIIMPEMNGRDLAKNLLSLYPHIKRLFTSGYTADVIAHHGVLDEGVHFIQKPFSVKDLAAKLREVLDG